MLGWDQFSRRANGSAAAASVGSVVNGIAVVDGETEGPSSCVLRAPGPMTEPC